MKETDQLRDLKADERVSLSTNHQLYMRGEGGWTRVSLSVFDPGKTIALPRTDPASRPTRRMTRVEREAMYGVFREQIALAPANLSAAKLARQIGCSSDFITKERRRARAEASAKRELE